MTQPTEINPSVLAQSVFKQGSGEAMTFTMLASGVLDAAHVARVRVWLADRLVLDVELDRDNDNHVVHTFDDAEWANVLLAALIYDEDAARAPRPDH